MHPRDVFASFLAWFILPDDPPLQRTRKTIVLLCAPPVVVFTTVLFVWLLHDGSHDALLRLVFCLLVFAAQAQLWGTALILRRITDATLAITTLLMTLAIICLDWERRAAGGTVSWQLVVIVLDGLLIFQVPTSVTVTIICATCLYLVVAWVEEVWRFGMYDTWGLADQDERYAAMCACDMLPCGRPAASSWLSLVVSLLTLLLDFGITRSFARQVRGEKERLERATATANVIADMLAAFDTLGARDHLDTRDAALLNPDVRGAFERLVRNLEAYRPYLPQSLLGREDTPNGRICVQPPGLMVKEAAIMFTDIVSSTKLWSVCPTAMTRALKQHNACIRAGLNDYGGYEVKTIGDAFMAAFPRADVAVQCALHLQRQLLTVDWVHDILSIPECHPHEEGMWGGLCLRIGVDAGNVQPDFNDVTKRYDYFGDVVNCASRLETCCPPGAVAMRKQLAEGILPSLEVDVARGIVEFSTTLKGFTEPVAITAAVPEGLEARVSVTHAFWTQANTLQDSVSVVPEAPPPIPAPSLRIAVRDTTIAAMNVDVAATLANECRAASTGAESDALHTLQSVLESILCCLQSTSGVVVATVHTLCVTSWSGFTTGHLEASARFVAMFRHRLRQCGTRVPVYVGLASSPAAAGTVGNNRQRFLTTTGPCVDAALHLGSLAKEMEHGTLYGVILGHHASPALLDILAHNWVMTFHSTVDIARPGGEEHPSTHRVAVYSFDSAEERLHTSQRRQVSSLSLDQSSSDADISPVMAPETLTVLDVGSSPITDGDRLMQSSTPPPQRCDDDRQQSKADRHREGV